MSIYKWPMALLFALTMISPVESTRLPFHAFYGAQDGQMAATAGFVNVAFEPDWGDWNSIDGRNAINDRIVTRLIEAKRYGIETALIQIGHIAYQQHGDTFRMTGSDILKPSLRYLLTQLEAYRVMESMEINFYPLDEVNGYHVPEATVAEVNEDIRSVLAEFPNLRGGNLAVIYACNGDWTAIETYDWYGCDDYPAGSGIFYTNHFQSLKAVRKPHQRLLLVPGGAMGQEPTPFLKYALENPEEVVGVITFIWFDNWANTGRRGVESNGMAEAYCLMGMRLAHPELSNPDCRAAPPEVELSVNGVQEISVPAGTTFNYEWSSSGASRWYSTWSSTGSCADSNRYEDWDAHTAEGAYSWPAHEGGVGCTFDIMYVACNAYCSTASLKISITPPVGKRSLQRPPAGPPALGDDRGVEATAKHPRP
jgi:hypothetical protein